MSRPKGPNDPIFIQTKYGSQQLCYERHLFNRHVCRQNIIYWRCTQFAVLRCRARIKTHDDQMTLLNPEHNHPIITEGRKYGELKELRRQQQELQQQRQKLQQQRQKREKQQQQVRAKQQMDEELNESGTDLDELEEYII